MAADGQERAVAKTYVPEYQKAEWERHAEKLDMTQSEYLRVMVQAGRKGFLEETRSSSAEETDPRSEGLEDRIVDVLRSEEVCSWDRLVEALTEDLEDRVEEALEELQRENLVTYSGRDGGYTLLDDGRG